MEELSDSIIERLYSYARKSPHHEALVTSSGSISYLELVALVESQAERFLELGLSEQSTIGIDCADETAHLILNLAAIYIGATSCTIPSYETEAVRQKLKEACGLTSVVDGRTLIDLSNTSTTSYRNLSIPSPANQARLLFSTSGTTGTPKRVVHYDNDIVAQAHRHVQSGAERFACVASIEHNFSKRHRLYCLAAGATNVFLDSSSRSLVEQSLTLGLNVLHLSAFQAQELLALPDASRLSNVRIKLGGSHVPLGLREQLRSNVSKTLQAGYGTTETGAIAFTDPEDLRAGESVGQALPGIEVRIVSPGREPLNQGEQGEIAIRCKGMFREYLGEPELTRARLENHWFYTGDMGYLDEDLRIHLCGRSDDMFLFNSINIYPQEIESQLCQFPGIKEALVVPKASDTHGNIPVALVVFETGDKPDLSALKRFAKSRLGIRRPWQITAVEELPRTQAGKISRVEAQVLSAGSKSVRQAIAHTIQTRTNNSLKQEKISAFVNGELDINVRDVALDSLARVELLIELELNFGAIVTPDQLAKFHTLGELASYVEAKCPEKKSPEPEATVTSCTADKTVIDPTAPYLVRLLQRVLRQCNTVAELNHFLEKLANRLVPEEIECLNKYNKNQYFSSTQVEAKFHIAIQDWLSQLAEQMGAAGKSAPEPYSARRLSTYVFHYAGTGKLSEKTLLLCFAERGGYTLSIPNSVLLQHTDANRYDVLIIAEPLSQNYELGVPRLGANLEEISRWLLQNELINSYQSIRTLGCSAGGYAALLAGYVLGAELAVSVAGRLHLPEKNPILFFSSLLNLYKAKSRNKSTQVLLTYAQHCGRDRRFAKTVRFTNKGDLLSSEFAGKRVHRIFSHLAAQGDLKAYLDQTVFVDSNRT